MFKNKNLHIIICCLCILFMQNNIYAQDATPAPPAPPARETEITTTADNSNAENNEDDESNNDTDNEAEEETEDEKTERLEYQKLISDTKENIKQSNTYNFRDIDDATWKKAKVAIPTNYNEAEKKLQQQQQAIIAKGGNNAEMTDHQNMPQMQMPNLNFLRNFSVIGQILIYVLIAAVIGLLMYLIFQSSYFQKQDKNNTQKYTWEDVAHFDEWETALQQAIAQQNFRLATRILFLQSLQKMHQQNLIQFQKDYTNAAYLQKIAPTNYFAPFARLTNYFEKIWYGHYTVNATQFANLQTQFIQFQNTL